MDKVIQVVASKIANYFACNNYILKEKEELYRYSIVVFLQSVITIITMLLVGTLFGYFFENICFMVVLKLLRNYSGGFHSSKFSICYLISISSNIIVLLCLYLMESSENYTVMMLFEIISVLTVVIFAPIVNENKPISLKEFRVYKLITIFLSIVLFIVSIILLNIDYRFAFVISITMTLNSVLVIAEKIIHTLIRDSDKY